MFFLALWLLLAGGVSATSPQCEQRIVVASLEAIGTIFSGNGVYTQSVVQALAGNGDGVCVGLLGGYDQQQGEPELPQGVQRAWPVPVAPWRDLTMAGGWLSFVDGSEQYRPQVRAFRPDVVLCIDWHGCDAWRRAWGPESGPLVQPLVVFFNFRVFSASRELHGVAGAAAFYRDHEGAASRRSDAVLALARQDLAHLARISAADEHGNEARNRRLVGAAVVLPCLRGDVRRRAAAPIPAAPVRLIEAHPLAQEARPEWFVPLQAALAGEPVGEASAGQELSGQPARHLLSCCVRASPEKRPDAFVRLVELLSRWHPGVLRGVVPVLCLGGGQQAEGVLRAARLALAATNATDVKANATELRDTAGGVVAPLPGTLQWQADLVLRLWLAAPHAAVVADFLDADGIEWLFQRALLNVHPPVYDAYGMTVAEAGAFGAPTLLHSAAADDQGGGALAWGPAGEGPMQSISPDDWDHLARQSNGSSPATGAGVWQLLAPVDGVFAANLSDESLADAGEAVANAIAEKLWWLLRDGEGVDRLRTRLRTRVLSWDVVAMGRQLLELLAAWRQRSSARAAL